MGRKSNAQKAAEAEAARLAMEAAEASKAENEEQEEIEGMDEPVEETKPKRRGRKPKEQMPADAAGDPLPNLSNLGVWSNERYQSVAELPVIKDRMKIEIQLKSPALGMSPSDPDALKYVAKKADEMDINDGTTEERTTTIWPKAKFIKDKFDGHWILVNEPNCPQAGEDDEVFTLPFIYDYQIRGMYKDSCGLLSRSKNNQSADLKSYKKRIDGNIFVVERKIPFNMPDSYTDDAGKEKSTYTELGGLQTMSRPLRISGPSGERSAISTSEIVPPESTIKFEVLLTDPKLRSVVVEWLDYGLLHGIGQWRNSGIGIYRWRELDENWEPKR